MTGATTSRLLHVQDKVSGRSFLIDTGAEVSLVPASPADHRTAAPSAPLVAANGTEIKTYGTRHIPLQFGNKRFKGSVIIADVNQAILGADFLRDNRLLVDLGGQRLVHSVTYTTITAPSVVCQPVPLAVIKPPQANSVYANLLTSRPKLTELSFRKDRVTHGVELHIDTGQSSPLRSPARRLSPGKLAAAKAAFKEMEDLGIVRRSSSQWASPLHIAPKPGGGWRPCGDFRRLNGRIKTDCYPVPHIQDFASQLSGKTIFSKIDLIKGYHQIPVRAMDIPKTAVITPFGLFEFLRTPFGLANAAQAFQRLMDTVLQGLQCVFIYLDDILIASSSPNEHLRDLTAVFDRLEQHGLVIHPGKCIFGVEEITFLGHVVNAEGIRPMPTRVTAIQEFPRPTVIKELQAFLGVINFYHRFVPAAARLLHPLNSALVGRPARTSRVKWTTTMDKAFQDAKKALASATLLVHPRTDAPTAVTVDASDSAIGGVLEQFIDGLWRPLAFFSRKLQPAQTKYSAFDRELLAAHAAIRHFKYFLEGRQFSLFTDHKPLTFALSKRSDAWSARQQRQLSAISEFTVDIRHVAGKDNVVADALSRAAISAISGGIDFSALAAAQRADPVDMAACRTAITGLQLKDIPFGPNNTTLLCDVSLGRPRPLVPASFRRRIFDTLHGLSHPGIRATRKLVARKYVWHGLGRQVGEWAKTCIACQRAKVNRHLRTPLSTYNEPILRFDHVNVDLVGPLPPSNGFTHLLTVVDRVTRWPEAIPLASTKTKDVADAFLSGWITRYGLPSDVSSDRGPQFTSQLWEDLSNLLGTKLHRTTAYHPQANGLVERFHRSMKASLKARCQSPSWTSDLHWVMLGLRTMPKEDLGTSPAELVFGAPLTVPGEFVGHGQGEPVPELLRRLRDNVAELRPVPPVHHSPPTTSVPTSLSLAKFVFIRHDSHKSPLQPPYDGPFRVLAAGDKFFKIQVGHREETISIDRLKIAHVDEADEVQVAQPPRRGRPPGPPRPPAQLTVQPTLPPSDPPYRLPSAPTLRTTRSGREIKTPARFLD